jgi:ornithine carbamoyltransferase
VPDAPPNSPRHLVSLLDWSPDQVRELLELALRLKADQKAGRLDRPFAGRTLALIFEKASMRTRVSFEVAMTQLGGAAIYLSKQDVNLGEREPISDGARVLDRYVDAVAARVYNHEVVEELARFCTIPVINALSDRAHPCQALADTLTVRERFGATEGRKLCFVGDGNNVARSLAIAAAYLGMHFTIASPPGYGFDAEFLATVRDAAGRGGGTVEAVEDPREAVRGADAVYTDVWVSMGQEHEAEQRRRAFADWQLNAALMREAGPQAIVLHCLPAHRGQEITDEVIESPQSAVFDQAGNRLHAQRALLYQLIPRS